MISVFWQTFILQIRQTTWPEVTRLFNAGLGGLWSMGVFLILGYTACHITGPSVVMSVVIAAITAVLTGRTRGDISLLFVYAHILLYRVRGMSKYVRNKGWKCLPFPTSCINIGKKQQVDCMDATALHTLQTRKLLQCFQTIVVFSVGFESAHFSH